MLIAPMVLAPQSGGGSDGCARGFDTRIGARRGPASRLRAQKAASSGEEAGVETHYAQRGLKTLPPGLRPEQLPKAPGPQRCDGTVRGTSVLQQALKKKEEEEEKKVEMKEKEAQKVKQEELLAGERAATR